MAWIIIVGFFVAMGIKVSAKAQYVLMALQMIPMALFTVWALIKGYATHPQGFAPIRLSWFFTTHVPAHALAAGVVLAVFLYWGWDTVLAVNEESEDSSHMPGVSAVLNTIILVLMYVVITAAMQCYHGADFLAKNPSDVFSPLARDVMGGTWDRLVFLCLLTSGAASALTTMLPLTRQTLSMAAHKSLPAIFGRIHPKYMTPFWGTVILSCALDPLVCAGDPVERERYLGRDLGDRHHGLHRLRRHRPCGHRLLPQGAPQERQELLPDGCGADRRGDHVRRDPRQGAPR